MTCEVANDGKEVILRHATFGDVIAVIKVWLTNKELVFTRPEETQNDA